MSEKLSGNFGAIIKERRLLKKLSTITCARQLKIKQDHIRAIESNNASQLPTGPRLEKMLHDYLRLLGFLPEELQPIINYWHKASQERHDNFFGRRLVRSRDLWSWPQLMRNGLIIVGIIVAIVYIALSLKNIVAPPRLTISSPAGDIATSQRQLWLIGQTEPEVQLEVNGEPLLSDPSGRFSQPINLRSGVNNLNVTAIKKYGGRTTVIRQIMVAD